jgi:hypothetical protein
MPGDMIYGNTVIKVGEDAKLPKRELFDFYPTPWDVIEKALMYADFRTKRAGDIGAGSGRWGRVFRKEVNMFRPELHAFELQGTPFDPAYDYWHFGDVMKRLPAAVKDGGEFDLLFGNPPFYLFGGKHVGEFFRTIHNALTENGRLILFARSAILESAIRYKEVYSWWRPSLQLICTNRVSFYPEGHPHCGKTNATAHSIFIWDKMDQLVNPQVKWIHTVNDNRYTGPHKGTNTWQDMIQCGLIKETDDADKTAVTTAA